MKSAYLGLPDGAAALSKAGHDLMVVGLSRRRAAHALGDSRAPHLGVDRTCPVLFRPDMNEPVIQDLFATAQADLLVCYLWDRILPSPVIESFSAVLNYHPSLLPRHRGADPTFWTIWSGDQKTGVSVMQVDAGVDTGPILAQREVAVPARASAGELADILDPLGLELLLDVVERWERDGPIAGKPQQQSVATDAPSPNDDLLEIRWSWPSKRIERLIRAGSPHPGAFTAVEVDGELKTLVILAAHCPETSPRSRLGRCGDAFFLEESVMICTGDGGLVLDAVQLEGEEPQCGAQAIVSVFSRIHPSSEPP